MLNCASYRTSNLYFHQPCTYFCCRTTNLYFYQYSNKCCCLHFQEQSISKFSHPELHTQNHVFHIGSVKTINEHRTTSWGVSNYTSSYILSIWTVRFPVPGSVSAGPGGRADDVQERASPPAADVPSGQRPDRCRGQKEDQESMQVGAGGYLPSYHLYYSLGHCRVWYSPVGCDTAL